MFDGTFRLLKMEAKFLWALVALTFTIATAVVRGVTFLLRKILRREAPAQAFPAHSEPVIPTALRSATPAATPSPAPVTVNVTINNGDAAVAPAPPAAAPAPVLPQPVVATAPSPELQTRRPAAPVQSQPVTAAAPAPAPQAQRPAAQVLRNPDHGIYLTTGSSFMVPHPYAAGLLEQLDYMLYQGAHRKGSPWTVPPALDTSGPSQLATPLANLVLPDDGVDDVPCRIRALPATDGAIWVARTARDFERQVSN